MGRASKRVFINARTQDWLSRQYRTSDDDQQNSGIDWLSVGNDFDDNIYKIIEEYRKFGDLRLKWISSSDLFHNPSTPFKKINLENPEGIIEFAEAIMTEVYKFNDIYGGYMNTASEQEKEDLETYVQCYQTDITLPIIYHRICNNICKYFVGQNLSENEVKF